MKNVFVRQMNVKLWRELAQILYYHNDLIEIIKPFFENLWNENIHDEIFLFHFLQHLQNTNLNVYIKMKFLQQIFLIMLIIIVMLIIMNGIAWQQQYFLGIKK